MSTEILGIHYIAELCECNSELLNDSEFIMKSLKVAIDLSNATLLEELKYDFTPQGITAICLLSESHISIHTWPEKHYAAVDIFTCGSHTNPQKACEYMKIALQSNRSKITTLERGL